MSGPCPYPLTGGAFLRDTLAFLDCQAQTLGAAGYQALASSGSVASIALTSLLTIFVAIFGIRMILGHTPDVQDGVTATVKVGVVLVLATSWPAFRTLAYDVVVSGPAQIVNTIGGASALPGATGGMAERLQNVDDLLLSFVNLGSGQPLLSSLADLSVVDRVRIAAQPVSDGTALGIGRTAFLTSVIGPLAIVRLGAGFLLAIAPLFAGLLLFEATRGWFFGWLRALVAVALGAAVLAILFGTELAVIEPWLGDVLARRAAGSATPAAAGELLALTLSFGVAAFGLLALMVRLAFTVHLPTAWTSWASGVAATAGDTNLRLTAPPQPHIQTAAAADANRATLIADAVSRSDRRNVHMAAAGMGSAKVTNANSYSVASPGAAAATTHASSPPVGQQFRRARPRISASAKRRDR